MGQSIGVHVEKAQNGYVIIEETTEGKLLYVIEKDKPPKLDDIVRRLSSEHDAITLPPELPMAPLPPQPPSPQTFNAASSRPKNIVMPSKTEDEAMMELL